MPLGNSQIAVPKGQLKIAQRFNAGESAAPGQVPEGRLKEGADGYAQSSLRDSNWIAEIPALKRRAILGMSLRDTAHRISDRH